MFKIISRIFFFFSPLGVRGWLVLPTVYCLLPTNCCTAQDKSAIIKYAREIIDTLAAPGMHGRGYVNRGDSIAAEFIKKEFEKIGVKPAGKEFFQKFQINTNTFPGNLFLKINKTILTPGKDYLINSDSKNCNVKGKLIFCNKSNLYKGSNRRKSVLNQVVLLDTTGFNNADYDEVRKKYDLFSCSDHTIIYIEKKKLTRGISKTPDECSTCYFTLLDSSIPKKHNRAACQATIEWRYDYQSQNILGYVKGTQYPDSFIVFSAHYDHLGRMGKDVYFPGANDNASGCAMLLNLAKYYSQHPPKYSVAFFAFGAEEVGLLGSKYYVEHPLFPLKQIKFLVNMDIMGTGDEGIKVVNATEHKKEFDELVKINAEKSLLPVVSPRGKSANSDHYFFSEAGVKTFFIYTLGGIKAYHDIYDRPETLPLTKFEEVFKLLTSFADYLQKTE